MRRVYPGIAKNFSVLIIAQMFYKILAFFTYIIIARYLGVYGFGEFSSALSFVGLFAVCLDFGLSELLIRDVAGKIKELSSRYISNILSLKLLFTIASYLLIVIIGLFFFKSHQLRIIVLVLALCLVLDSFTLFFRYIFRLFEKMEFEALSIVCESILKLGLVFIVLKFLGISIFNVACTLLVVSLATLVLTMAVSIVKFSNVRFSLEYIFAIELLKKTLPFAFLIFFGVINFKITIVIVSSLLGYTQTGWYSAAVRLLEPILIVPVTAAVAVFPTMARLYKGSNREIVLLYKTFFKILFVTSIGVILALNIFAGRIVLFIFGNDFLNAIKPFRILSLSLVPFFLKFFLERFLLVLNRPAAVISSYIFGTLIVIITGIIMGCKIGYIAVGMSLVFAEFFIVGYNLLYIKRWMPHL